MEILVHGTPTPLAGKVQTVGKEAPAARITMLDGSQNVIGMIAPTVQLLIVMPSLKTEVCSLGAKKFNAMIKDLPKLSTIMVTTDDRSFVADYVAKEAIDAMQVVIDADRHFGNKYGVLIKEGKLKDRLARAVFIIDREGVIAYKEIVPEIVNEVNYDACIEVLTRLVHEKKKGHTHENWMSV